MFLIGCGRVGISVASGLERVGYRVVGVRDTDARSESRAARLLRVRQRPGILSQADIILIATPDAQIAHAYRLIARSLRKDQTLVHFSGALASEVFAGARRRGVSALAMHPVMTFPSFNPGRSFQRCWFALVGDR